MTDNVALVQASYDGFAKGDVEPLLEILHPEVEWNEAEHSTYWPGGSFVGPQAVIENVIARLAEDFDDFAIEVGRMVGSGGTVLVEARYRAIAAKATGRPLDAQVAHVWDLEEGKVVRWQQYTDTWLFAELTGVTPTA
ncbi:nuclear transport factor 2 family protein [Pseudonocardia sp. NPDC049154]|uniref:nuclear transport factor 2 family protein n=1 Tax=Pseudonocardia sp. NPDC049154 TaxID=3155501 RepID=UPI003411BD1F